MRADAQLESPFAPGSVHVGLDVGGRSVVVAREEIARYAAGTGARVEETDVAPAFLYHSEVFRDVSWYLPNLIGNLHARQEWELFHPMRVGDALRSRVTVVERYAKRGRLYVVAEVLWTDAEGRWLQRSRTHQSFLPEDQVPAGGVVVGRERRPKRRFDTSGSGVEIHSFERRITQEMCDAFSGPARNYHNDREKARELGFPEIVVQGMMPICFVAEILTRRFGGGFLWAGKLDVRLVNVVWLGDVLAARARIREIIPEGERERALLDVWCEKEDGTVALIGQASAIV